MSISSPPAWKEEAAIIILGILGIVLILKGQDAGLLAAVITAIAGIAGYKLGMASHSIYLHYLKGKKT